MVRKSQPKSYLEAFDSTPISGPWGNKVEDEQDTVTPTEESPAACAFVNAMIDSVKPADIMSVDAPSACPANDKDCKPMYLHNIIEEKFKAYCESKEGQCAAPSEEKKVEQIALPFSAGGKLVGVRHFGPLVVNIKKSPNVKIIAEDPKDEVIAASSCVLL